MYILYKEIIKTKDIFLIFKLSKVINNKYIIFNITFIIMIIFSVFFIMKIR